MRLKFIYTRFPGGKLGAEVIRLGVAKDTRTAVEALLESAANSQPDLILSSAGVSVGAFDFIKEVIESEWQAGFWRVNMCPGKPLAFGEYRESFLWLARQSRLSVCGV